MIAQGIYNDQRTTAPQYRATLYSSIASIGISGTSTLSGDLVRNPGALEDLDTITVTVKKEWIRDMNGIQMDADFVFTFTTP